MTNIVYFIQFILCEHVHRTRILLNNLHQRIETCDMQLLRRKQTQTNKASMYDLLIM